MPDSVKIAVGDVTKAVEHVLAEKNGTITVTIQDGVILEIEHKVTQRRSKQPNNP